MYQKMKDWIPAILAVVILYAILFLLGITCPIKFLTGVSCAGCGMTRAWLSLLRLDFHAACMYHPLFWMPPVVVIILACKQKIPEKILKRLLFTVIVFFVIIYLYRMLNDSAVVVFEPENGIIFRLAKYFYN